MIAPKTVGRIVFAVFAAAGVVLEFALPSGHEAKHWWSRIPAFYAIFGFAGAVLLAFGAKLLGKRIVGKDEDYYDR